MLLHDIVLKQLRQSKLIPQGTTVVIGVSGGRDSMVLAHILYKLRHSLGIRLYIAHFNHNLRKTALRDQRAVEALAKELNIPILVGVHPKSTKKVSEAQAREWRFKFFAVSLKKAKADMVVLAHHQQDVAETVLLRLLRGSGLQGLRGILNYKEMKGLPIVRPLLDIPAEDIARCAKANKIAFCHDETNDADLFLRNKVRNQLLPLLVKDYNPSIVKHLAQLADSAGDDYAYLLGMAEIRLKENIVLSTGKVKIALRFFNSQPIAIVRLGVRLAYESLRGDLNQLEFVHVMDVCQLAKEGKSNAALHLPQITVKKTKTHIEFSK